MRAKLQKSLCGLSLSLILLSGCTVMVPDSRLCSVAGIMAGGGYCVHTQTDEMENLTPKEFYAFLEPDEATLKGAAICMSTVDFANLQIAIEQACRKLGASCSREVKEEVQKVSARVTRLREKSSKKPIVNPIFGSAARPSP